jgi:formamidopyrimidine-DNA glycosylase
MPELPEVQSTVDYLAERVLGLTILSAHIFWPKTIAKSSPASFNKSLQGTTITELFRRGKFVGMELHGREKYYLFTHLRMSGSLDVLSDEIPLGKHDRVTIALSNGKSIRFNDTRKFGRMYLTQSREAFDDRLGIEPLSDEFTPNYLYELLHQRKTRIKPLLLNQALIAGLGNIYVDECLWKAQIHPTTTAQRISKQKIFALHTAIQETLREAISLAGTDFGDGVVQDGMYSPKVYGREDEPCHRCGDTIIRTVVAQRGTHLCRRCQRR